MTANQQLIAVLTIHALILVSVFTVENLQMTSVILVSNVCLGAVWVESVPTFCSADNLASQTAIAKCIAVLLAAVKASAQTILFVEETKMMVTLAQLMKNACPSFVVRKSSVLVEICQRLKLNGQCLL